MNQGSQPADMSSLSYTGASDSEDDYNFSFGNENDALDNYNVSDRLKNLLRLGNFQMNDDIVQLDDESEDDSILDPLREIQKRIPVDNSDEKNNKYMNFPFKPPQEDKDEPVSEKSTAEKKASKPKNMKRREIEKENIKQKKKADDDEIDVNTDIMDLPPRRRHNVHKFLENLRLEDSDNEEGTKKSKKKTKTGRKSRKKDAAPLSSFVDENGERLVRTTELLDSTDSDSDDANRPMSKKDMLNMYRERERTLRASELKIKPTINVKSYNDFIQRRRQREQEEKLQKEKEKELKDLELQKAQEASSDSDIEIVYDSKMVMASPERARKPPSLASSPIRNGDLNHRNFNKNLVKRIYEQTHEYRKNMEDAAKARGHFVSASDRAQRLIEQERRAQLINQQIEHHFSRKPTNRFENTENDFNMDDEDYEDYTEENAKNDDIYESNEEEENDKNDEICKSNEDEELGLNKDENEKEDLDTNINNKINYSGDDKNYKNETAVDNNQKEDQPTVTKKNKRRIISDSEESDTEEKPKRRILSDSEEYDSDKELEKSVYSSNMDLDIPNSNLRKHMEKNDFVAEEAEEEDDEFFGMGGPDVEETEDLDRYEQDGVLVENNDEIDNVEKAALRAKFYEQDAETDRNMVQRLLKDITSGGLRKRKAALEEGFMFDDIDIYDDDNDLVAMRKVAAAKRRKMLEDHGGALEALAKNPKTEAFVRAARATRDGAIVLLDDSADENEEEEKRDENEEEENEGFGKSLNAYLIDDDDDEEEELEVEEIIPINDNNTKHSSQSHELHEKAIHLVDEDDEDDNALPFSLI